MSEEEAAHTAAPPYTPHAGTPLPKRPAKRSRRITTTVSGRMAQLISGELTVDDLDDDELRRGEIRDDDGAFRGRKHDLVPKAMHDAMMRRLLKRGQERLREDYFAALDVMTDIMKDEDVDPGVRLRAADMVVTRIAGKPVEKIDLSVEVKSWENVASRIIKSLPAQGSEVWDAEIVEDEDGQHD